MMCDEINQNLIEENKLLKTLLSYAEGTLGDVEDDLNRGSDNDWAREHIDDYWRFKESVSNKV